MPLKTIKTDTTDALTLEWVLHVKNYKLDLNKNRCVGCQVCSLACPKEAIRVNKHARIEGLKAKKAWIDVDLAKCNFCGICDILCPYGALKVTVNGQHALSVVEKESFPQLIRDIRVDESRCVAGCVECEDACPFDLIKVSWLTPEGNTIENASSLASEERARLKASVNVKKEYCSCCRICEVKCPEGVMHVRKFLTGSIAIKQEECPQGCKDCLDVCPVTGALYLSEEDQKVHVNEAFCTYCGACKVVCPVDEALKLKRTKVSHSTIRSGAWNKALERLTSPTEMSKELKSKGSSKARESVRKRVGLKDGQDN